MSRVFLCLAAATLLSGTAMATVQISAGPAFPLPTDLAARARWGGRNFEAQLLSSGVAVPGSNLNPAGNPVWQLGRAYDFRLIWDVASGTINWAIDFNRNGSFGAGETTAFAKPGRAGFGYQFINLSMTSASQGNGNHSNALDLTNLSINGVGFGNFTASAGSAINQWFEPVNGTFKNLEITGSMTFRNVSGNGAFAQERPNLNISFVGPEPVPEPASWAMLVAGFGLVGAALRRQGKSAPSWRNSHALRATPPA